MDKHKLIEIFEKMEKGQSNLKQDKEAVEQIVNDNLQKAKDQKQLLSQILEDFQKFFLTDFHTKQLGSLESAHELYPNAKSREAQNVKGAIDAYEKKNAKHLQWKRSDHIPEPRITGAELMGLFISPLPLAGPPYI